MIDYSGGTLDPGASCPFSVTVSIPTGLPFGTTVTNTSSAITGMIDGFPVVGDPAIDELLLDFMTFTKSFDDSVAAGDTATLTFSIENLSATDSVSAIEFSDDLAAVLSGLEATVLPAEPCGLGSTITGTSFLMMEDGNLLPGGSCTFDVTVEVPSDATAGDYLNTTSGLSVGGLPASSPASDTLTVIQEADLSITKADFADPVTAGSGPTYTFTVTNAGPFDATNVVVTDTLPAGVTLVSTSGCAEDPAGVPTCTLGDVAAGDSAMFTVTVTVDSGTTGVITNSAGVTSDTDDPDGGNNSTSEDTTVAAEADLSITKADSVDPVTAGEDLTYTITVANAGPSTAQNVVAIVAAGICAGRSTAAAVV